MKATLLLSLFFLFQLSAFSQPAIQWEKCYGGANTLEAYSVCQTRDSGYVVAGFTYGNGGDITGYHGGGDYWIVRIDKNGNLLWQKSLGGSIDEEAYSIQQTSDGGYIVGGMTSSNDGDVTGFKGVIDYWITKLDSTGNLQWQKTLGGSNDDEGKVVEQTSDGGYIVGGYTYSNDSDVSGNHGDYDYWVVKLNSGGNIQWQKCYGGSKEDKLVDLHQTSDNGYIMAGFSQSTDGDVQDNDSTIGGNWIVKLDSMGTIQWQRAFIYNDSNIFCDGLMTVSSIMQTNTGGYLAGGSIYFCGYTYYFSVTPLDSAGNVFKTDWFYTHSAYDFNNSIRPTKDDGYIIAGYFGANRDSLYVLKNGTAGKWSFILGNQYGYIYARCATATFDGGYIIAGRIVNPFSSSSCHSNSSDYKIIKLSGTLTSDSELSQKTNSFSISPNPFSSSSTLQLNTQLIPIESGAEVVIYDMVGKEMMRKKITGDRMEIEKGSLGSGVYFVKVSSEEGQWVEKMVVE